MLGLHNVRLSKEGLAVLLKECKPVTGNKTDTISYRDALQRISINMEVDEPLMKEWTVRSMHDRKEYSPVPSSFSLRSSLVGGGMSTNQVMKQLNSVVVKT